MISLFVGRSGVTSSLMGGTFTLIPLQLSSPYLGSEPRRGKDSRLFYYPRNDRTARSGQPSVVSSGRSWFGCPGGRVTLGS
jgi:hypothetical protein